MRSTLAVTAAIVALPMRILGGQQHVGVPAEKPWVILVHDSGLAGGADGGLVFALWRDGTLVRERSAESRAAGKVRIGRVDAAAIESIRREIAASGLWERASAPQYLDLPEDGLVIRDQGVAKCWFDTRPTAATPGLKQVADAVLKLKVVNTAADTITDDQWLPWSHYREEQCR
jgi:hypothetical protein